VGVYVNVPTAASRLLIVPCDGPFVVENVSATPAGPEQVSVIDVDVPNPAFTGTSVQLGAAGPTGGGGGWPTT
jgi:hypothetical protein